MLQREKDRCALGRAFSPGCLQCASEHHGGSSCSTLCDGSTPSGRWRAKGRAPSSSALGARQTEYLRDQDVRRARREVRLAAALPARTKISFCKLNPSPMRTSYSKNRCRVDSRASEQSFAATSHTNARIIGDGRRSRIDFRLPSEVD